VSPDGAVHLRRAGAVARITFDRPAARNAMTMAMYDALEGHLEALAVEVGRAPPGADPAPLRVVVLRGAGGAFVAGTDIAHFTAFEGGDDGVRYERRLEEVVGTLEALPLPTMAVVEGAAMGGGLILAAACDLRVCTPDARFGAPIARTVGNCLSVANVARLVAHLGPSRTRALLLLAGTLDAAEARGCGFVQEVVEAGALEERVGELCARLASLSPLTLRATKEAVRRVTAVAAADGDDLVRQVYGSADFRRGVRAFLAKERPEWEGR
jgi:enoyl-CoA hydratase